MSRNKLYSDKTARKHLHGAYDYDAELERLRAQIERHEQTKRIVEEHGLVPISGADVKKGTILYLKPMSYNAPPRTQIFPFVPYRVTRKVKSRAYRGTHPPDWNIDIEPIGHTYVRGHNGIRKDDWLWTLKDN